MPETQGLYYLWLAYQAGFERSNAGFHGEFTEDADWDAEEKLRPYFEAWRQQMGMQG